MTALDISAMMWHIICGYIEGGTLPLSGVEELDCALLRIYERQSKLKSENFLFGRLLGDFLEVAQYERENFEVKHYHKIWTHLISYVCSMWRLRYELVSLKLKNLEKYSALREVDSILDNNDVTYVTAGNKSLLNNCPDTSWKLTKIQSWLRSIKS